jgi:LmbE family N-acetylglucosaminyl deacetylase
MRSGERSAKSNYEQARGASHGVSIFLLPHQDDELFLAPIIKDAKQLRFPVVVVYLTDGAAGARPDIRNAESRQVLRALGVDVAQEVVFLGQEIGVPDGFIDQHFVRIHRALVELAGRYSGVTAIYAPAWEGGHPDHDAAHTLAVGLCSACGVGTLAFQVPFYRKSPYPLLSLAVWAPLPANGPVAWISVGRRERLKTFLMIRFFPSQLKYFVNLGPLMLVNIMTRSGVPLQRATLARLRERPTQNRLLYPSDRFDRLAENLIGYLEFMAQAPTGRLRPRAAADPRGSTPYAKAEFDLPPYLRTVEQSHLWRALKAVQSRK